MLVPIGKVALIHKIGKKGDFKTSEGSCPLLKVDLRFS